MRTSSCESNHLRLRFGVVLSVFFFFFVSVSGFLSMIHSCLFDVPKRLVSSIKVGYSTKNIFGNCVVKYDTFDVYGKICTVRET